MSLEIWIVYVTTVLALMSTPGPSHLLMLSNSITNGFRPSLLTACGDLTANTLQMLAAGLGLAALIVASNHALTVIKFVGVAYLLWLGLRMIRNAKTSGKPAARTEPVRLSALWLQGFITSATNPKAVIFFAALFPQFISQNAPFWPQFLVLSATYVLMDGLFLSFYGATASWIGERVKGSGRAWLDRIGGTVMIVAAIMLSLKTVVRNT